MSKARDRLAALADVGASALAISPRDLDPTATPLVRRAELLRLLMGIDRDLADVDASPVSYVCVM